MEDVTCSGDPADAPPASGPPPPGRPGRHLAVGAAVAAGLVVGNALVFQATSAAFVAEHVNSGSSLRTGTVALEDAATGNPTGTALFSATGLLPGSTGSRCVRVVYRGDVAATVRMYLRADDVVAGARGSAAPHLRLVVHEGAGTADTDAACTGFGTGTQIYPASPAGGSPAHTLAAFATAAASPWSSGAAVGDWRPDRSGQHRWYKITYTVLDVPAAQGTAATARFTWEAQT